VVALGGAALSGAGVYEPRRRTDGAIGQVFDWINLTFPNPKHRIHNGCTGGTSAIFVQACLRKRIPFDHPDLVILEFDMTLDATPGKS
jgi:hypothetical protein